MKSIWNGSISFGLVSIPIQLYSVAQEHALGFKMLCSKCNNPITMKRWCAHCKKEVAWDHVVKGLELSKGEYFVITQDVIKSLKPVKSTTINIRSFISADLVDPVYINTHYYAAPADKHTDKAYTLLHYALGAANKVALGSFVMRDREHVCMIQSYHTGLLLTTLYYDYEIRPIKNIEALQAKPPTIATRELTLAKQLIAQLTHKTFDISDFKDTFAQELKKLIKNKKEGKIVEIGAMPKGKKRSRTEKTESSLMEILKASLKEDKKHAQR